MLFPSRSPFPVGKSWTCAPWFVIDMVSIAGLNSSSSMRDSDSYYKESAKKSQIKVPIRGPDSSRKCQETLERQFIQVVESRLSGTVKKGQTWPKTNESGPADSR